MSIKLYNIDTLEHIADKQAVALFYCTGFNSIPGTIMGNPASLGVTREGTRVLTKVKDGLRGLIPAVLRSDAPEDFVVPTIKDISAIAVDQRIKVICVILTEKVTNVDLIVLSKLLDMLIAPKLVLCTDEIEKKPLGHVVASFDNTTVISIERFLETYYSDPKNDDVDVITRVAEAGVFAGPILAKMIQENSTVGVVTLGLPEQGKPFDDWYDATPDDDKHICPSKLHYWQTPGYCDAVLLYCGEESTLTTSAITSLSENLAHFKNTLVVAVVEGDVPPNIASIITALEKACQFVRVTSMRDAYEFLYDHYSILHQYHESENESGGNDVD